MATIKLEVYLFFPGNCKEAMDFYKGVFGGEVFVQTFDEVPGEKPANSAGKVMHASLTSDDVHIMASDSTEHDHFEISAVSLSLSGTDEAKLRGFFDKLAEGGKVTMPIEKQSWGALFGSLTDKYGFDWMVNIEQPEETKQA